MHTKILFSHCPQNFSTCIEWTRVFEAFDVTPGAKKI